ncbi:MAG: exodeoxyribonuclease VII small subunit [Candidatus Staskawiczbacteria bacterium]|nr:exodeoxyribonuclease VII small subunit [Candidatus Staskawiczbacteria bacterium]
MKNLKDSLKKLKEIVEWFDKAEEVDIEAGLEKIKEGTALIKESRLTLKNLENEFEKVKNDLEDNNEEGINNGLKNEEKL